MQIIGIDCASKAENTAVAIGTYQNTSLWLSEVYMGNKKQNIADFIYANVSSASNVMMAIDAPLGWSEPMGRLLALHQAGEPIAEEQDRFFRRLTDTFVHQKTGKLPLEVGADRIARTAHSALKIIGELRAKGLYLPMCWEAGKQDTTGIIEVYPSATLRAYQTISSGYKGDSPEEKAKRKQIIQDLAPYIPNISDLIHADSRADMLDAVVCLLAAKDFLEGAVYFPEHIEMAKKEGWIWVRK
jgi:predicted RNase H-like nuclease